MRKKTYILFLSLIACSGEALDVGEDENAASGGTGGTGGVAQEAAAVAPLPDWTPVGICPATGVDQPQFVGTWEGAVEDFYFNPITPLRLVITKATSNGICGNLSWDTAKTPPLPLTDPAQSGRDFGHGGGSGQPIPGLTYTLTQGAARDTDMHLLIAGYEHWQGFCEMQTELHYTPGVQAYTCLEPNNGMGFSAPESPDGDVCTVFSTRHGNVELPLKQCVGCAFSICKCNAETCTANADPTFDLNLELDQTLDGEDILVTSGGSIGGQSIRLERAQ
jgi:hypothetical protein